MHLSYRMIELQDRQSVRRRDRALFVEQMYCASVHSTRSARCSLLAARCAARAVRLYAPVLDSDAPHAQRMPVDGIKRCASSARSARCCGIYWYSAS